MLSVDQIRSALKGRDLKEVAEDIPDVHYNTIRIFMMEGSNPTWRVVQALSRYVEDE